jgi:Na+-transporting methylmalonyl-CoA/oxaloacetate decarboxylase gamma subunit
MELSNGLIVMFLGMTGVFAILAIMFFFMKVFLLIDGRIKSKKPAILPAKINLLKKSATIAALHHHNKKHRG